MNKLRTFFVLAVIAVLGVPACHKAHAAAKPDEPPARVIAVPGSDVPRVVLSARAYERLGIQLEKIVDGGSADGTGGAAAKRIIPYAAVLYDAKGDASTYTNPENRTFVRQPVTVDRVDGDRAILTNGPPVGTMVVTVGAAELLGVESGVGEG